MTARGDNEDAAVTFRPVSSLLEITDPPIES